MSGLTTRTSVEGPAVHGLSRELVAGPSRCYRKLTVTARPEDEDDWTGEPPEGHHPRGSADPGFWRNQRQAIYATSILGVVIVLAVILILVVG